MPFLGLVYVIIMSFDINLKGQLFLHDIFAPLMGIAIIPILMEWKEILKTPVAWLFGFLAWIAVMTIYHYQNSKDLYEFAIYAYMAVLFLFYKAYPLTSRMLKIYGAALLLIMFIYLPASNLFNFSKTMDVYDESTLSLLTHRYFFTFEQPNMTGSFYILPITCLLLGYFDKLKKADTGQFLFFLSILTVVSIPLALTVSKHIILSIAVVFGLISCHEQVNDKNRIYILLSLLLGVFVLFYLTVLFPFFPLKKTFPFFNTETLGMYTIHQGIYLKMTTTNLFSFLFGVGRSSVIELYPQLADPELTRGILAQYHKADWTPFFVKYLDSHNEYLNIGASFGYVAVALVYGFFYKTKNYVTSKISIKNILFFYIVGIFMVSLWDDILSKRWIWISLALILSQIKSYQTISGLKEENGS